MKKIGRRPAVVLTLVFGVVGAFFLSVLFARKKIVLAIERYEKTSEGGAAAIVRVTNRSRYCYTFRFKRNSPEVPYYYTQTSGTAMTQWLGEATLGQPLRWWPRPMLAGETIYLRIPLPTNGPVTAKFELEPVKTVDDVDSVVWDLREAGEDLGIISKKLVVTTEILAAPKPAIDREQ